MPRSKTLTKKLKAKRLTKVYIESGLNQSELARKEGVTRQTINKKINSEPVKDKLQEYLDSPKLDKKLMEVAEAGLGATQIAWGKKTNHPDHNNRHKFWRGLMESKGKIKTNGKGSSVTFININYGYRSAKQVEGTVNA